MTPSSVPFKSVLFSGLDDLLDNIGVKLQISETAHNSARKSYHTIAEWLRAEGSPLAEYEPDIYSQGSLRIRTTVKPKGEDEYDLDLVCVLNTHPSSFSNATEVLDLIEERIKANKTYDGMVERKNRCIRINYAHEFHMDILPACPNPLHGEAHGEHCLKVPDCSLEDWKDSNPKGYANWFENKAQTAVVSFRKSVEPLPEQQSYEELQTLNRVVQLMKRYRDISLEDLEVKERPISIVLTTLAAHYYNGSPSVIDALEYILFNIKLHVELNASQAKRIVVLNPTNSNEDLSERWDGNPEYYTTFVTWIAEFLEALHLLRKQPGLPEAAKQLKEMFGENVINEVVKDYTKRVNEERLAGNLAAGFTTGLIVPKETPKSTQAKPNNFHGMINFKRKQLTVAEQIAQMAFAHPHFELRRKKLKIKAKNLKGLKNSFSFNTAVWVGEVRPTEMSRLYTIKIEYIYPKHPTVSVISPKLELAEGKDRLPHTYGCGSLCLYTPKKGEWHIGLSLAATIVPWISFWLYYYEIWVITGEWLGDEVDPYHVKNL